MKESDLYYRDLLYKKLIHQLDSYKNYILSKDKNMILDASYEITIKSEIVEIFIPRESNFELDIIKSLLKREYVLEDLYEDWMKSDSGIHSIIKESLDYDIEKYKNKYQEKKQDIEER